MLIIFTAALPMQYASQLYIAHKRATLKHRIAEWSRRSFAMTTLTSVVVPTLLTDGAEDVHWSTLEKAVALMMEMVRRLGNPPMLLLRPVNGNLTIAVRSVRIPSLNNVLNKCIRDGIYVLKGLDSGHEYEQRVSFGYSKGVLIERVTVKTAMDLYALFETRRVFMPARLEVETSNYIVEGNRKKLVYVQHVTFIDDIPAYIDVRYSNNKTLTLKLGPDKILLIMNGKVGAAPRRIVSKLYGLLKSVSAMPVVYLAGVVQCQGMDVQRTNVMLGIVGSVDLIDGQLAINASATVSYMVLGPYAIPTSAVLNHLHARVVGGERSCEVVLEEPLTVQRVRVVELSKVSTS